MDRKERGVFEQIDYAGFWLRVVAYIIDCAVLSVVSGLGYGLLFALSLLGFGWYGFEDAYVDCFGGNCMTTFYWSYNDLGFLGAGGVLVWLLSVLGWFFYYGVFESSRLQATPGKLVLGLRVCDGEGRGLSFWRSIVRNGGKYVSAFLLCIGFLMAGFTREKQCLHDMIVGALVVRRR